LGLKSNNFGRQFTVEINTSMAPGSAPDETTSLFCIIESGKNFQSARAPTLARKVKEQSLQSLSCFSEFNLQAQVVLGFKRSCGDVSCYFIVFNQINQDIVPFFVSKFL
jgi:hypothetical protein